MHQRSCLPASLARERLIGFQWNGVDMEYRLLGETGFKVPVLSLGTATFGGSNDFFKAWGSTDLPRGYRRVYRVEFRES